MSARTQSTEPMQTATEVSAWIDGLGQTHKEIKATRGRGATPPELQGHLATVAYLKGLEGELERIRAALDAAWAGLEDSRQFRKCVRHADAAQQRLHRVIKKLAKQENKMKSERAAK